MPPPSFTGRTTFFYPRLVYNAVTIDFTNPCHFPEPPGENVVAARNISLTGLQETLYIRSEIRVHMIFKLLSSSEVQALRTYWINWGRLGYQAVLTLDRLGTCAGQYEYDVYNTFFDKAEIVTNPFAPARTVTSRDIYGFDLVFRQGADFVSA